MDRVVFKPFSSLQLSNFEWQDKYGKIVASIETLESNFTLSKFFENKIEIEEIKIENGFINIELYKDSSNISNAITYFTPKKTAVNKDNNKLKFSLNRLEFKNNHFKLINHNEKQSEKGIDFSNLDITEFSAVFDDINLVSSIKSNISALTLKEKSGFIIRQFGADVEYSTKHMEFKNLYVSTNNSILQDYLKFEYDSISDFSNFIKRVNINANINSSRVSSRDIEYFAPSLKTVIFDTQINNAKLSGTIADIIAKDVNLKTGNETELIGDFTIKGLPKINTTVFNFNIKELNTSAEDVELIVPKLANQQSFKLPIQLFTLGKISYAGSYVGLYNDFNIDGEFSTDLGRISTASKITIKTPLNYIGQIASNEFDLGRFIDNNTVQKTAFKLDFDGQSLKLNELALKVNGSLENTYLKNYSYNKILLEGNILNENLQVQGQIDDENLNLDFSSSINWRNLSPEYLLDAKINHAALNKLNWIDKDSVVLHSAVLKTNLQGNSLNTLVGNLYANSIQMSTSKGNFEINNIDFTASGDEANRVLYLESDVADAKINGNIDLNTIIPYFKSLAMRYAPASAIETSAYNPQNFNLEISVKSFNPIAALIDQNLSLDDGAYLNADFSSNDYSAKFIAYSPTVIYKDIKLTNLSIHEMADEKAFSLDIMADRLNLSDSTYINNITINNKLAKDTLHFNIEMSERNATNYLNLNGNIHFAHNAPAYIKLQQSSIILNRENWRLNNEALMRISKGKIYFNNLILSQNTQQVKINGIVSNDNDHVDVSFDKFNLNSLNGITKPLGIHLQGTLNGMVQIHSVLKNPFATANIHTGPIIYNNYPIGTLQLDADYRPETEIANIDLNILDENNRGVHLFGDYNFSNPKEPLQLKGKLNEANLVIFQPFLKNLVSNLKGRSNAEIDIIGSLKKPQISGIGNFKETEFTVNYLKTLYKVDNQFAQVQNNIIKLDDFGITDSKNQKGVANGFIDLSKLITPYIDVNVQANKLMILNTTYKDNNQYYGTAYATGSFKFKGFTSAIAIDINAKSESGTVITLPFNSALTVSDSDFIYFINKDSDDNQNQVKNSIFRGITMNMDLNLTPDAELNLQTKLGSLKGNGTGIVSMKISSLGDFEMFGDYIVNNGKFHFTAQDFINKYFDIKEGGTIRWSGNPSDANINLNAIYQQRTSIYPLYNAAGRDGEDERVLAQADMLIKGTLEKPDISFDLNFPQNPYIKDQLQSFLSDANNVNQQALSLIVRRSFTPSTTDQIGREVNNTLLSAGAEVAFNQLNNIISQSLNVNFFDLNIRSFNDASASFRFWDDRLVLTGGITDRTNFQATDLTFFREGITTDAELTFRLRKDGRLMLRAYNRPYTRNFLLRSTDSDYISALGLVYRQEFNSISEFWKRLWFWGGIKKEDKPKEKK